MYIILLVTGYECGDEIRNVCQILPKKIKKCKDLH